MTYKNIIQTAIYLLCGLVACTQPTGYNADSSAPPDGGPEEISEEYSYADLERAWANEDEEVPPSTPEDVDKLLTHNDFACLHVHGCLTNLGPGLGYSAAENCFYSAVAARNPSPPPSVQACVSARGGIACFERWAGCSAPRGNPAENACIRYAGGLTCYARY